MHPATESPRPLVALLLQFMLMVAVCLPTGSIFGLNVKIPVFALFFLAFGFYIATHSSDWLHGSELVFMGCFTAALCFWALIAIFHGQSETAQVFLQLKDIASTVVLAWLCIFFVHRRLLRPEDIVKPVIYGALALAAMKLLLIAVTIGPHIDPIQLLTSVFGEDALVGGSMAFGLTRVEFSSDIIGSFALFAILCPSVSGIHFRRFTAFCAVGILLASGLLAFARYIWFLEFVAIVAALIVERKLKLLAIAIVVIAPLTIVYYEALQPLVEARFFSDQVSDSDLIRIEQFKALSDAIKVRPLIGNGLGTHVNEVIRNQQNKYSYELQWVSLFMQFGFLGICGIMVLIAASARDLFRARHPAKPWLMALFALWLLSGWTNPHLTSSFAGATFGMFMALFYAIRYHSSAWAHGIGSPMQLQDN
jgi:hypothetical protein